MRSSWNGTLGFGLVSLPVKLYNAVDRDAGVKFHQVHDADGGQIRYKRVCELDGQEIPYENIAKGFKAGEQMVVFTDDDLDNLPLPAPKQVQILSFIPDGQVDESWLDTAYFVEPEQGGLKAYVLLRDAIAKSGRVALARFANRAKEHLALVRAKGDMLLLQTVIWPEQARNPAFAVLGGQVDVTDAEQQMATMLLDSMTADWDPGQYHSGYAAALETAVANKLADVQPDGETAQPAGQVVDLTAALEASVAAVKAREEQAA